MGRYALSRIISPEKLRVGCILDINGLLKGVETCPTRWNIREESKKYDSCLFISSNKRRDYYVITVLDSHGKAGDLGLFGHRILFNYGMDLPSPTISRWGKSSYFAFDEYERANRAKSIKDFFSKMVVDQVMVSEFSDDDSGIRDLYYCGRLKRGDYQ